MIAIHLNKLVNALPISFFDPYLAFHVVSRHMYFLISTRILYASVSCVSNVGTDFFVKGLSLLLLAFMRNLDGRLNVIFIGSETSLPMSPPCVRPSVGWSVIIS